MFFLVSGLGVTFVAARWYVKNIRNELPDVKSILDVSLSQANTIVDRDGEHLRTFYYENRVNVGYEAISPHAVNALIAMEDQSFWTNP